MFRHQTHNSIGSDVCNAFIYKDINYLTHIHKGFELLLVLSGEIEAEAGDKKYTARPGESLLIMPYQLHSYKTPANSRSYVIVFNESYVGSFAETVAGTDPESALLKLPKETLGYIEKNLVGFGRRNAAGSEWVDDSLADIRFFPERVEIPPIMTLKACLYAVIAEYLASVPFLPHRRDGKLAFDMLSYIENNYATDISLRTMASALGYDYRYISRIFAKTFEINFKTLVNQHRCDKAKILIAATDENLSDVAVNSGFQSIRSFNRIFKELTGRSPSDFRKIR